MGCSDEMLDLFNTLSNAVHGAPWYGDSVRVMGKHLSAKQMCLVRSLCDLLRLEIDFVEKDA